MRELLEMVQHKQPRVRETSVWKHGAARFVRNFNELQRLRIRRPELYEAAVMGLVNHIVNQVNWELGEPSSYDEQMRRSKPFRRLSKEERGW